MATATEAPAISLGHINKWFPTRDGGDLHVLKDITFDVPQHGILAILGASGCGKSTLLHIVAGLLKADSGQVSIEGVPSRQFTGWDKIGYVFQDDRLLPWRTTQRNVEFALEPGDMPRGERARRARAALELVRLQGFESAFPHQLSGGMRSRVAIARSLVREPSILLMDEPFSRLDALTRVQMHEELLRIHGLLHMSIVFVTHDVEEAAVLADRVVVLAPRPGRVHEIVEVDVPRPRDYTAPEMIRCIQHMRGLIGADAKGEDA
ncbi:MAG TPA: ABC transporter ATP-binding protein [Pelomicrobium sp.]|nr:ABC transporter ATP-binding protein [Pelomicrobium sp.]